MLPNTPLIPTTLLLLLFHSIAVSASPVPPTTTTTTNTTAVSSSAACESVHFFIARGSEEPYPGRQASLVDATCSGIPSCGYEDITYPATFSDYCASAHAGVTNGAAQITAYAARCPGAKLVLTGYSQGGHVIGDILGGGGGSFQGCTQPTNTGLSPTSSPGNQIVAATFFGDVRHAARQTYNAGTGASGSGIWPRSGPQLTSLNTRFSTSLRSWCLSGDPVCARGDDFNAHTAYFDIYTKEAAAWLIPPGVQMTGPIVRMGPFELHVSDPAFFNTTYRQGGKWDKYAWNVDAFTAKAATIFTPDHPRHKARREPLNPYFAKSEIFKRQEMLHRRLRKLLAQITRFAGQQRGKEESRQCWSSGLCKRRPPPMDLCDVVSLLA
ncbi:Alpha/Beta hydrolase protein [Xylariomycetidae sp. FL2044]|nr:Alpha/Beta hydrolase protein [Xylariomycetidae sp. FL2044]